MATTGSSYSAAADHMSSSVVSAGLSGSRVCHTKRGFCLLIATECRCVFDSFQIPLVTLLSRESRVYKVHVGTCSDRFEFFSNRRHLECGFSLGLPSICNFAPTRCVFWPMSGNAAGVCIMSSAWKAEQSPSLIRFISEFLSANSFRLNFVSISPDLIFNCGGVSVAFVFVTKWNCSDVASIFSRVKRLKGQFAQLYVVVTLPTREQNDSFVRSYFEYGMEFGKPAFVPVTDAEMGFEKIVKIAHSRGVCKQQNAASKLKAERKRTVQDINMYVRVVTSIPSIDKHDANTLYQAIGSIEAIAKASKEDILANTDLSSDKAEIVTRFFRDPEFYLSPKFN